MNGSHHSNSDQTIQTLPHPWQIMWKVLRLHFKVFSFGSRWSRLVPFGFPSPALAWSQYEPKSQAGSSSLLSICVLTPLSQPQYEFLLSTFNFHSSFKGHHKPSATLSSHRQAACMSFGFRLFGVWILSLLLIGCRTLSNSLTLSLLQILSVKWDNTTSPCC